MTYEEIMQELQRSGKISGAYTDMPVDEAELLRRLKAARDVGLVKDVQPLEKPVKINQDYDKSTHNIYAESRPQVVKNISELRALGFPEELLMPLNQRKAEESLMMKNLNRKNQPAPGEDTFISDRSLGLDPSKFTKKPWRPQDYFTNKDSGMAPEEKLQVEQEKVLGAEVPVNKSEQRRLMLMKMMGIDPLKETSGDALTDMENSY